MLCYALFAHTLESYFLVRWIGGVELGSITQYVYVFD